MIYSFTADADFRECCPYCRRDLTSCEWESVFDPSSPDKHYKATFCECGREIWLNAESPGSGHDSWDRAKLRSMETRTTLESRIQTLPPKIRLAQKA